MTGAEARRFMDAWAAEQNEIVRAKQNIRNLIADFREYVEDAGVDFDEPAVRPMMEQYLRHAKWGLSKTLSGMARARSEVAPDEVLAAYDRRRSSFDSPTATATHVAKHETFTVQHQRRPTRPVGSKVHVSRNLILGIVRARSDGKERRPAKTRGTRPSSEDTLDGPPQINSLPQQVT